VQHLCALSRRQRPVDRVAATDTACAHDAAEGSTFRALFLDCARSTPDRSSRASRSQVLILISARKVMQRACDCRDLRIRALWHVAVDRGLVTRLHVNQTCAYVQLVRRQRPASAYLWGTRARAGCATHAVFAQQFGTRHHITEKQLRYVLLSNSLARRSDHEAPCATRLLLNESAVALALCALMRVNGRQVYALEA
jgi:hypothetical protein